MQQTHHSRQVSYTLVLERIRDALAPASEEWGLETRVYLTRHFEREPVTVRLREHKPVEVTVSGRLPVECRGKIDPVSAICFAGTAFHRNDSDVPVKVDVGTSHIMLSEMELTLGREFQKDVALRLRVVRDSPSKATIRVTLKQKLIGASLQFGRLNINANLSMQRMEQYVNDLYQEEMSMDNTIPGTDNVRCFLNLAEESTQLTQLPVPAFAYVKAEVPRSNAAFWKNALENVLDREGYTCEDYLRNMNKQERSRIAFLVMDYPITVMPYIGDAVFRRRRNARAVINAVFGTTERNEREPTDNWGACLALLGGDCEDLALGITLVSRSLSQFLNVAPLGATERGAPPKGGTSSKAAWFQVASSINEIMDQYVPLMSLCVVHGAKADDNDTMPKGAHMAVIGLPIHYFKACLEASEDGKMLSKTLPWPQKIDAEYETNIGEGTGMLDPRGYRDPKAHVRAYLHRGRYFNTLKHPMVQEHGAESPFFLGALQGYTTYFSDRGASEGVGAFWYTDSSRGNRRGALYTDFTNERKNVNFRPMLEPPEDVQYLMQQANAFAIPPEPLTLSEGKGLLKNRDLDKLSQDIKNLGRAKGKESTEISLYVAPHQMNKALAQGLLQDIKESLPLVWNMTYKGEHMTDLYHAFRLTFSVNA